MNAHPERVRDPAFTAHEFFDARDRVQVKYEMLRRVRTEEVSVTQAAAQFGFSRPTFYEAKASFEQEGVAGLVPKKRGPRSPHKLRGEVLEFLTGLLVPGQPLRAPELAKKVQQRFGIDIHPRTIERAVRSKKNSS